MQATDKAIFISSSHCFTAGVTVLWACYWLAVR